MESVASPLPNHPDISFMYNHGHQDDICQVFVVYLKIIRLMENNNELKS